MILFIFGIIFPQPFPRVSENNTLRRDFHIRKTLFVFSSPSSLVYGIVTVWFLKLILEEVTLFFYSASTEGLLSVPHGSPFGELQGGETADSSALTCYLLSREVTVWEAGTPVCSPNAVSAPGTC